MQEWSSRRASSVVVVYVWSSSTVSSTSSSGSSWPSSSSSSSSSSSPSRFKRHSRDTRESALQRQRALQTRRCHSVSGLRSVRPLLPACEGRRCPRCTRVHPNTLTARSMPASATQTCRWLSVVAGHRDWHLEPFVFFFSRPRPEPHAPATWPWHPSNLEGCCLAAVASTPCAPFARAHRFF